MKKRGQGEVIKYFIIAIIIIVITFFGYNVITKITEKACNAEIAKFEIDLKNIDKSIKFGSVKEFTQQVPCDVDEIYFFDLDKDINLDFLEDIPLIKDSVQSKVEKNIFLLKDNKILNSFYAGNLDIEFPNYICFLPKFEKINFFLEGKGKKASVFSGCLQPECTYIPVTIENEEAVAIFDEAKNFGDNNYCPGCPRYITSEFAQFVQTRENVDVFRKYEYCKETGKTNVEIIIRPKEGVKNLRNIRIYESIPKNCIDNLQAYLSGIEGEVSIKNDPLIIWKLDEIKTEEKVSYVLDTELSDDCKEAIESLGVVELIEGGKRVPVPEVPTFEEIEEEENSPPEILDIPTSLFSGLGKHMAVGNLWQYARDAETLSEFLFYRIAKQLRPDVVECSIEFNKQLICDVKKVSTITSGSRLTIQVEDPEGLTDETSFNVLVEPVSESTTPSCQNTATSCGTYPNCQNCNLLDSYSGAYCLNDKVVKDFNKYSCIDNQCVKLTPTQVEIKKCESDEICLVDQCVGT